MCSRCFKMHQPPHESIAKSRTQHQYKTNYILKTENINESKESDDEPLAMASSHSVVINKKLNTHASTHSYEECQLRGIRLLQKTWTHV